MLPESFMTRIPKTNFKRCLCCFGSGSESSRGEFLMSCAASQLWVTGSVVNRVSREQNASLQLWQSAPLLTPDTRIAVSSSGTMQATVPANTGKGPGLWESLNRPFSQHLPQLGHCPPVPLARPSKPFPLPPAAQGPFASAE